MQWVAERMANSKFKAREERRTIWSYIEKSYKFCFIKKSWKSLGFY